jgi:hypothetical protein
MPSPRLVLSDVVAFTGWACPLAVRAALASVSPRCAALLSTSGPSSTEESVAFVRRCRRASARCSLGLWIDSFPTLPRNRAAQHCWTFRLAARTALASPDPNVGGRQGVSALSGSLRSMVGPPRRENRRSRGLRLLPKESPRPHSTVPEGRWSASGSAPRGNPPRRSDARRRSVADVIATHLRRDSFATQRRLRRAAAGGSSSFSPSFRGCPRT